MMVAFVMTSLVIMKDAVNFDPNAGATEDEVLVSIHYVIVTGMQQV